MRKEEFLSALEVLLSDISQEEREEAMAFYRSYFEDAGIGNEEKILRELESPEKVAETIKRELGMITAPQQDTKTENRQSYQQNQSASYSSYHSSVEKEEAEKKNKLILILVIIIGVLTSPGWIGLLLGLFGVLFGFVVTLVAVTAAMFAVGLAGIAAGIPMMLSISSAAGIAFIGVGFLFLAIAVLFLLLDVLVFGKVLPWMFKGIANLCKKLFKKKETAA